MSSSIYPEMNTNALYSPVSKYSDGNEPILKLLLKELPAENSRRCRLYKTEAK